MLGGRLKKYCVPHMIGKLEVKGMAKKRALHSRSELVWNP
jgi:hypothetical protein